MNRELALNLFSLYQLEKQYDRPVFPEELRAHSGLSQKEIKSTIESLLNDYSIQEMSEHGANVYTVTNIGIAHLQSYLDLKREL